MKKSSEGAEGTEPFGRTLRLGVVCPMANEVTSAAAFVEAVLQECERFEFAELTFFAVLDKVSSDGTRTLLETLATLRPELVVIWAPETRGVADAYVRGYREALAAGCDWILEIDAGFSHDPTEIPKLFQAMLDGADCVFGTRFAAGGQNLGSRRRRAVSRGGTLLARHLLGVRLTDLTGGFELFTRGALEHVLASGIRSTGPFFQTEIKVHCRRLRIAEVPIRYDSASHHVGTAALSEAFANLARLVARRLTGRL